MFVSWERKELGCKTQDRRKDILRLGKKESSYEKEQLMRANNNSKYQRLYIQ